MRCLICKKLSPLLICHQCQHIFLSPNFYKREVEQGDGTILNVFSFYRYGLGQQLNNNSAWDNINRGYMEDNNGKFTIPVYYEHDNGCL